MKTHKIRINTMDVLILAVILAAAALLLYVFVWSDESETNQPLKTEITYVVEVIGIEEQFAHSIMDGQVVEDAVKRGMIGTVKGTPEVRDTLKADYSNDTGMEVYSRVPGRSNLYITITAEADVTPRGYMVNGEYIYVGAALSLMLPDIKCDGYCIRLDAAE